ncbi:MAG: isoprenyl transferase [Acidobacteriota bacterium]|nr:isoprenyl transferase [Acidobacteriota bacterium]
MHTKVPAGLTRKQAELYAKLDPERLPHHLAIIMDGNGRWARRRHLPRIAGHKRGVEAVRDIITLASRIHIPAITLYAFSAENWKRPKTETSFLMQLLRSYLKNEVPLMNENNIRLRYIGRLHELAPEVQERMQWASEQTAKNTGMVMTLALNYGARSELVDAFRAIVAKAASNGGLNPQKIDEELISRHMYNSDLPDPDLVIRTSGEMRLSNFLLWQLAYTEIYVTQTLWPDFDGNHLLEALDDFQKRERRYGNVGAAE